MNINVFFIIISAGLLGIFLGFKPLDIKQQHFVDVPIFELKSFTLYELNKLGLESVMVGDNGIRYSNRYEVENINYTDSSKGYLANIKADKGLYKNDTLKLNGHVEYQRDDGLVFQTKRADYNKKTKIAYTDTNYVSYMGKNIVKGSYLRYDSNLKKTFSKNVTATYQLKEER